MPSCVWFVIVFTCNARKMIQDWFDNYSKLQGWLFSGIWMISTILLWKIHSECCRTWSELVKNWDFERMCRWLQQFFIDYQLFYFLVKIIPEIIDWKPQQPEGIIVLGWVGVWVPYPNIISPVKYSNSWKAWVAQWAR